MKKRRNIIILQRFFKTDVTQGHGLQLYPLPQAVSVKSRDEELVPSEGEKQGIIYIYMLVVIGYLFLFFRLSMLLVLVLTIWLLVLILPPSFLPAV